MPPSISLLIDISFGFIVGIISVQLYVYFRHRPNIQVQCAKLARRIDDCLDNGTYDRNEIARWRDRLDYISAPPATAKRIKKAYNDRTTQFYKQN